MTLLLLLLLLLPPPPPPPPLLLLLPLPLWCSFDQIFSQRSSLECLRED